MEINTELQYATLDDLYLDPKNPRLGRHYANPNSTQEDILDVISDWTLDELAVSYLESGGFWTYEALLVVEEKLYGEQRLVVVEGNRRLAALMYLRRAVNKEKVPKKWSLIIENSDTPEGFFEKLFNEIPYIQADSRQDIEAFLGFRHVTGIKQWNPEEKAQYIAWLINERNMTYEEVMRKIGSKIPTVRENYISYQLLLQIESDIEDFSPEYAEGRFSVMYLTLKKIGVQKYLQIDIMADPETAKRPVPEDHLKNLENFARWLFGNKKQPPLFSDSRQADDFNTILTTPEAVSYLERDVRPNFDYALQLTHKDELEIIRLINNAGDNIQISLGRVHHYKDSQKVQSAVEKLAIDFKELLERFPSIQAEFLKDD